LDAAFLVTTLGFVAQKGGGPASKVMSCSLQVIQACARKKTFRIFYFERYC
jgi:hypothetical protein